MNEFKKVTTEASNTSTRNIDLLSTKEMLIILHRFLWWSS